MSNNLDKLKNLTIQLEKKLTKQPISDISFEYNLTREKNIQKVKELYDRLHIYEKSPDFDKLFGYKAMNLSGISLKEDDFAQIRSGKYIQIIAIVYDANKVGTKKARNISLGYFGKAENVKVETRLQIIEFVLRWRYEKAFAT